VKAVLLGAGLGTRLAPLTDDVPKILAPLGGRPLLAHQLDYLAENGVTEVALNVSHHADLVQSFLDGTNSDLVRRVSFEPELLGTAGALVPLREFLTDSFILLYGDVVTDTALVELMQAHRRAGGLATLAYYDSDEVEGKGLLSLGRDERVEGFVEKPREHQGRGHVNAGIYALEPEILEFVPPGPSDFGKDVWPAVLATDRPVYGHRLSGYIRDIGDPQALAEAQADLAAGQIRW
jgi:mannose-1-phosphate guanylyltransferase